MKRMQYTSTFTNAMHNRTQAQRLFDAGYTPKQIARLFPDVWSINSGLIGQMYDQILSDDRKEISIMMSSQKVDELITELKQC